MLDDLPKLLIIKENEHPSIWDTLPYGFMMADKENRIGFILEPSRERMLRKALDAQLDVYYDGRHVRRYSGEIVNELYGIVSMNQHPPTNAMNRSTLETTADAALERFLNHHG